MHATNLQYRGVQKKTLVSKMPDTAMICYKNITMVILILFLGYAILAVGKRILVWQAVHANENPKVDETLGFSILVLEPAYGSGLLPTLNSLSSHLHM
jgi:hypothetical protein